MTTYCSNCGNNVVETSSYCPNCGHYLKIKVYNNNTTNQKASEKLMLRNIVIGIIVFLIIAVIFIPSRKSSNDKISTNKTNTVSNSVEKKWYEGGTLHKASMQVWKISTDENKLATCSDFIAQVRKDNGTPFNESEILTESYALKRCIDASQDAKSTETWKVSEIAALCLVELGYR